MSTEFCKEITGSELTELGQRSILNFAFFRNGFGTPDAIVLFLKRDAVNSELFLNASLKC